MLMVYGALDYLRNSMSTTQASATPAIKEKTKPGTSQKMPAGHPRRSKIAPPRKGMLASSTSY
jgi:hypothetical protein